MTDEQRTEKKIGKVTYIVYSRSSETAQESLENKIKKLIKRDINNNQIK